MRSGNKYILGSVEVQVPVGENEEGLLINQLDTTNNPIAAEINNDCTNHGLYIHQDGVLAASKYAFWVYSNVAQTNSVLCRIDQAHASSDDGALRVGQAGTGYGIFIDMDGNAAGSQYPLGVISSVAQTNSPLVLFRHDHASTTTSLLEMDNDGTGHSLYIHQDGILAAGNRAVEIGSTVAQTNGEPFMYFNMTNASSTNTLLTMVQAGTGTGLRVEATTGVGVLVIKSSYGYPIHTSQSINSASTAYGIRIDCNNAGAGGAQALYLSGNCIVSSAVGGSQNKKIKIEISGVQYYIPCNTA